MAKKRRRGRGEGAVFYSEAKNAWVARMVFQTPSGDVRWTATGRTKTDVLQKRRLKEEELRQGAASSSQKVGDWLQHWLDKVAKPSVEPTTWQTYEQNVRLHLKPRLNHLTLAQFGAPQVEALFDSFRRDGYSSGLTIKVRQTLSTAVRCAARRGLIATSPVTLVPQTRNDSEEIQPFTKEEVAAVLSCCDKAGGRFAAAIPLAFATGARRGEILALGRCHLDLDDAVMRVERSLCVVNNAKKFKKPKSRSGRRTVSLPPFAVEALRKHLRLLEQEGNASSETVFCKRSGALGSARVISSAWERSLAAAGVPFRRFHNTRHTHASQLLALGVPINEVARRIGDRPETILKVYSHYLPSTTDVSAWIEAAYGRENQQGSGKVLGESPDAKK